MVTCNSRLSVAVCVFQLVRAAAMHAMLGVRSSMLLLLLLVVCLTVTHTHAYQPAPQLVQPERTRLNSLKQSREGITALKRVVLDIDDDLNRDQELSEMSRKRKGLQILQRILNEMEADLINEQKRACRINLGGHCATESAAAVADQWHYLNSPLSPGRKRRDTRLFKKLLSGELIH